MREFDGSRYSYRYKTESVVVFVKDSGFTATITKSDGYTQFSSGRKLSFGAILDWIKFEWNNIDNIEEDIDPLTNESMLRMELWKLKKDNDLVVMSWKVRTSASEDIRIDVFSTRDKPDTFGYQLITQHGDPTVSQRFNSSSEALRDAQRVILDECTSGVIVSMVPAR